MKIGDLVRIKFYPNHESEFVVGLVIGIVQDTKYTRYVKLITDGRFTKVFCLYKEEGLDIVEVLSSARG